MHSRQRAKCKDCFPGLPQEDLQRGLGIGLMEPCWMRPPDTPENFAHLCLIVLTKRTNQSANCFFQESWLLAVVTSLTHLNTGTSPNYEHCKVLVCETDSIIWVSRSVVAFYPFKVRAISDTNFTEIFSKREGVHNTLSFQEAVLLANMFSDTSTPTIEREEALSLLKMGFLGRQKFQKNRDILLAHRKFCEEQKAERLKRDCRTDCKTRICKPQIQKAACTATEKPGSAFCASTPRRSLRSVQPCL